MDPLYRSPSQQTEALPLFWFGGGDPTATIATIADALPSGSDVALAVLEVQRRQPIAHHHSEGPSQALKQRLADLAEELLLRAGKFGATFSEVRLAAETRGLLTGHEYGRWLSFGDGIMRHARGKNGYSNGTRKSQHPNAHRRRNTVHVHEQFAEAQPTLQKFSGVGPRKDEET